MVKGSFKISKMPTLQNLVWATTPLGASAVLVFFYTTARDQCLPMHCVWLIDVDLEWENEIQKLAEAVDVHVAEAVRMVLRDAVEVSVLATIGDKLRVLEAERDATPEPDRTN